MTTVLATDGVSREQAIHIATHFSDNTDKTCDRYESTLGRGGETSKMREIAQSVLGLVIANIGSFFLHHEIQTFTEGVHKIYVATNSGEILGWGGER